jgi:hypothetical protein
METNRHLSPDRRATATYLMFRWRLAMSERLNQCPLSEAEAAIT